MSIQSGSGKVWKAPNSIHCISTSHAAERLVIRPLTGPPLSAKETQSIIAVQQTLWQEKWRSCLLIDCFLINTLHCTLNHLCQRLLLLITFPVVVQLGIVVSSSSSRNSQLHQRLSSRSFAFEKLFGRVTSTPFPTRPLSPPPGTLVDHLINYGIGFSSKLRFVMPRLMVVGHNL